MTDQVVDKRLRQAIVHLHHPDCGWVTVHGAVPTVPEVGMAGEAKYFASSSERAELGAWATALSRLWDTPWADAIPDDCEWGEDGITIEYESADVADVLWADLWAVAENADATGWDAGWVEFEEGRA